MNVSQILRAYVFFVKTDFLPMFILIFRWCFASWHFVLDAIVFMCVHTCFEAYVCWMWCFCGAKNEKIRKYVI